MQAEAELCVGLLANLRAKLTAQALGCQQEGRSLPGPMTVGFITFYRAQVACLRRTLQAALPDAAQQVRTVAIQPCVHHALPQVGGLSSPFTAS